MRDHSRVHSTDDENDNRATPMEYSPLVQILILLAAVLGGLVVVIVTVSACSFITSRLRAAKRYGTPRTVHCPLVTIHCLFVSLLTVHTIILFVLSVVFCCYEHVLARGMSVSLVIRVFRVVVSMAAKSSENE